jgi:hypothetical protein
LSGENHPSFSNRSCKTIDQFKNISNMYQICCVSIFSSTLIYFLWRCPYGATTLSIITFGIMRHSITTFRIMTLSLTLKYLWPSTLRQSSQWHPILSVIMLNVIYAECHFCWVLQISTLWRVSFWWVSLCWVLLCWVPLCWVWLCLALLCRMLGHCLYNYRVLKKPLFVTT